jgi:transcriptional regulator with XRE-family HTH domain
MRAPIGFRISNRRKSLKISQAALARSLGISASYLNLIENNKRDIGGALLNRVAAQLDIDIDELAGRAEQKLLQDLEEAFADPVLESLPFRPDERRELVAQYPASGTALARLHRAYSSAINNADAYADRLRSDPLLSQLLHQILSGITAIRSSAEILEDVPDLEEAERRQFLAAIGRETRALSDVTRNLIGQFETSSRSRRSVSPAREIDDLIIERQNHVPELEEVASVLRGEIAQAGAFGIDTLAGLLEAKFGVTIIVGGEPGEPGFPGQYRFDAARRVMWFQGTATLATRQFQLARLYGEFAGAGAIANTVESATLSTPTAQRLASRAMGSYLAGA